jgi:hypothetical protein
MAPAWDRSDDLQLGYFFRVFDFRTLYFILYYYLHRFSISGLFIISCRYFSQMCIKYYYSHIYYIVLKYGISI